MSEKPGTDICGWHDGPVDSVAFHGHIEPEMAWDAFRRGRDRPEDYSSPVHAYGFLDTKDLPCRDDPPESADYFLRIFSEPAPDRIPITVFYKKKG